ncbi:hypothetical protein JCM19236_3550 [Vibrio sp. JCM 19236]|nr:hypothetical protein JCM19236_3550 [Vibrio sp. JCM 19236]
MLTIGSQQALYLLAQLLVDEQTKVAIEDPGTQKLAIFLVCRHLRYRRFL